MLTLLFVVLFGFCSFVGCGLKGDADEPLRNADNNQVVNLGDSIFADSGDINNILYEYEGGTFRHYSRNGSQMIGSTLNMGKPIPDQYTEAKNDHADIKLVYMNGGINDFLAPFIVSQDKTCVHESEGGLSDDCISLIDGVAAVHDSLLDQMNSDGVDRVVRLGYYYVKKGLAADPILNTAIDYLNLKIEGSCNDAELDCTFIDPREIISDEHIINDGVHPSDEGSRILADLLWPYISNYLLNIP